MATRHSVQRDIILKAVRGTTSHPTAEAVCETVRLELPSVSLGTVYRNLKLLAEQRELDTLETEDSRVHYDGNTSPHRHFICKSCGKIIDLFIGQALPPELAELGLTVEGEKCVYYGRCGSCNKKA